MLPLQHFQASEEIQQLRRQIARGVPPGQASHKITSILEKAEKERDEADVARKMEEAE